MKLLLALAALAALAASPAAAQVIDAPAGQVSGTTNGGIRVFKGIPYARPPVGELRWKAPAPLSRWQGVRRVAAFGPACIQPVVKPPSVYVAPAPLPTSEDCLSLNVWSPAAARKAPVMVWIHGGALLTGSSREELYDARRLAERGVVVVSINYRVGALGYLAHPALSAENNGLSGNYGLLDQIAALNWIKANIAAFGGDPANVTIAGESAGALSVAYLMTAPPARGLFHKAIAQSAYTITTPALKTSVYGQPSGEAMGERVAAALKAPDLAALRAMDAQKLTEGAAAAGFQPWGLVDGTILPEQLVDAFDGGRQARVPVLAGFNQGEIRSLRILAPSAPADAATYEAAIRTRLGELSAAFLQLYPAATYRESILATTRDALYGWTSERIVRRQAERGQPSYLYLWDHGYPAMDEAGLHAFHASELPYIFGTLSRTGSYWPRIPATTRERSLSNAMIDYWTSFAATGVPRAKGAPAWPPFRDGRTVMHFADTPRVTPRLLGAMFDLNEEIVRRRRAAGIAWNWNVGLAAPAMPPVPAGAPR